ncbi:fibronectin type III-like domain-contianing protein [Burkholderia singularis]|nr:fibronectin type III-like domain-contianing protein [Burkholderia singularis]
MVQLYVRGRHVTQGQPVRELRGFQRIALNPGETGVVK